MGGPLWLGGVRVDGQDRRRPGQAEKPDFQGLLDQKFGARHHLRVVEPDVEIAANAVDMGLGGSRFDRCAQRRGALAGPVAKGFR